MAAFQYFDKDGSDYITVDELQQACVEHNMTDVFLEDIIWEVDQDNVSLHTWEGNHITVILYKDIGNRCEAVQWLQNIDDAACSGIKPGHYSW